MLLSVSAAHPLNWSTPLVWSIMYPSSHANVAFLPGKFPPPPKIVMFGCGVGLLHITALQSNAADSWGLGWHANSHASPAVAGEVARVALDLARLPGAGLAGRGVGLVVAVRNGLGGAAGRGLAGQRREPHVFSYAGLVGDDTTDGVTVWPA